MSPRKHKFLSRMERSRFSTAHVATAVNSNRKFVINLADRRVVEPDLRGEPGAGRGRLYSWKNCVQVAVVRAIKTMGLSTKEAKSALDLLEEKKFWTSYHLDGFALVMMVDPFFDWLEIEEIAKLAEKKGITEELRGAKGLFDMQLFRYDHDKDLFEQIRKACGVDEIEPEDTVSDKEGWIDIPAGLPIGLMPMSGYALFDINFIMYTTTMRILKLVK